MISILTATYNREGTLGKLYDSLVSQSSKNFEWVIVDDGSTDNTKDIANKFAQEGLISIRYIYKCNGGKHTALNVGVEECKGELIFFVDSDDYLTKDSIEFIDAEWSKIHDKTNYVGISGARVSSSGQVIGSTSLNQYDDVTSFVYRYKLKVQGDKAEVFRRDILMKYRFPEFEGERFLPEAVVFNRISSDGFILRWTNKPLIVCEYREDGLTSSGAKLFIKSWNGYSLYCKELTLYKEVSFILKLKVILNYLRLAIIHKKSPLNILRREN